MGRPVGKASNWLCVVPPCETTAGANLEHDEPMLFRDRQDFTLGDIFVFPPLIIEAPCLHKELSSR